MLTRLHAGCGKNARWVDDVKAAIDSINNIELGEAQREPLESLTERFALGASLGETAG